ncbi:hypothetical protein [Massilia sp. TWR1-2-2]|uniref:hypothetical protein n=1 Tax=Massilia sp. TWR1-2-2 TaxID=2804584 RepID=UPI003CFB0297
MIDLDTKLGTPVAEYTDTDIGQFQWVNENRLVYNLRDTTEASGFAEEGPGLFAVNRDGTERIQLAARIRFGRAPQPWNTFLIGQPGSQGFGMDLRESPALQSYR